jgi:hypothetical protein
LVRIAGVDRVKGSDPFLPCLGIPDDKFEILDQAFKAGKTVLLMHCGNDNPEVWRQVWVGRAQSLCSPCIEKLQAHISSLINVINEEKTNESTNDTPQMS